MPLGILVTVLAAAAVGTVFMGRDTGDRSWFVGTTVLGLAIGVLLWLRFLAV